ncbi:hypothetical protein NESM_000089300 [Novymonas esmeraldas]|uniref:EF-hand domain-containing protein n=1 Tax=Novymonas esmeraldas TaxID=1808958 RepID=A0AAW0F548_9TRYP
MSLLSAEADYAGVRELERCFREADPGGSGRLSYSEFAFIVLRCGGTQAQADALMEQFTGPSRAQRVVHYEPLLEQLYRSVDSTARYGAGEGLSLRRHTAPIGSQPASDLSPPPRAPTLAPLTALPSRQRSLLRSADGDSSHDPHHQHQRSTVSADAVTRGSAPRAYATMNSSRLIESAVRAAAAAAAAPAASVMQPTQPRDGVRSAASSIRGSQSSLSVSRSRTRDSAYEARPYTADGGVQRANSVERMTRAAANAAAASLRGRPQHHHHHHLTNWGDVHQRASASPRPPTPLQRRLTVAASSGRVDDALVRHTDSGADHSRTSTATATSLLSLRDVFHCLVAASPAPGGMVLLSDLEVALAAREVGIHPLELEAVADSLEPSTAPTPSDERGTRRQHSRVGASTLDTTNASATSAVSRVTMTGGGDRALSLVDFCILVSRLRPSLIRRLRSPRVWANDATAAATSSTTATGRRELAVRGADTAAGADTRMSSRSRSCASGDDDGDGAAIVDVTVSPMTPGTAASATPVSAASSPRLRPRATAGAQAQRRAMGLRSSSSGATWRGRSSGSNSGGGSAVPRAPTAAAAAATHAAPPTARQLSVDGQYSVDAAEASPHVRRRHTAHYATPTAASESRSGAPSSSSPPETWSASRSPPLADDHVRYTVAKHKLQRRSGLGRVGLHSPRSADSGDSDARARRATSSGGGIGSGAVAATMARSPTSTTTSPRLPSHVLETLQGTALALLRRCALLDRGHTGRIPPSAWPRVLLDACPALSEAERRCVLRWVRARGHRGAGGGGDDYAAVVEDVLATAGVASPSPATSTKRRAREAAVSSTSPLSSRSSTMTPSPPAAAAAAAAAATHRRAAPSSAAATTATMLDSGAKRRLASELQGVCGGDTVALVEYFKVFDTAGTGLLDEHVWRACLEELYRRTVGQEAPAWVVDGCVRLARTTAESATAADVVGAASSSSATATATAATAAVSSVALTHARTARVPAALRRTRCDYRRALEELGMW